MQTIRTAHTLLRDSVSAARDFYERVTQPDMSLVLFFCSSHYDLDLLSRELARLFGDTPVLGCTTAGEIGPEGCKSFSLSGASFPAERFSIATGLLGPLKQFEVGTAKQMTDRLKRELSQATPHGRVAHPFAFLMVDGLSQREEPVVGALHNNLEGIPIVGGSAGDNLQFEKTSVYFEGRFRSDHAVVVLVNSAFPIAIWKSQHFVATDQRMVITEADPASRRVLEINGLPAAAEYARLTGVDVNDLKPGRFASSPVVVMINGAEYVRSIQKANADGSLTFYCAIEEGLVIRVARGADLIENLKADSQRITQELGVPQAVLACDCVLRKLELEQTGDMVNVSDLMRDLKVFGFNSYGEQANGVHVNQTFTALAIGMPAEDGV